MNGEIAYISVIVCTHNPRPEYITRALTALKAQTLPKKEWELLIIDNASTSAVSNLVDVSWHANAAVINENELGLTRARLRGIRESHGDLIVFVDDDNLLAEDYLVRALEIASSDSKIGVFGAGIIRPEFEVPPDEQIKRHGYRLALRKQNRDFWANLPVIGWHLPYGAGLCATRLCANLYIEEVSRVNRMKELDRRGDVLTGCGDTHFGLTACLHGYLTGATTELQLTHLIPASRCRPDYLVRISEGSEYSFQLLKVLLLDDQSMKRNRLVQLVRFWRRRQQLSGLDREIFVAEYRGRKRALSELKTTAKLEYAR